MNEQEKVIILGEADQQPSVAQGGDRSGRGRIVLAGIVGGFSGALIVAGLFGWLVSHGKWPTQTVSSGKPGMEQQRIVTESDAVIVDTIRKSMPGVVSIVISKDVSKLRNFQSPFGNLPFFFNDGGTRGGSGTDSGKQQIGSGSGFFVSDDGLIVTNKHVVSDLQADYTVLVGEKEYQATVLARDPSNDIAILKINPAATHAGEAGGTGFTSLPLGDSGALQVGETVLAVGNPLGEFANSVSRGIVSGLKRTLTAGSGRGDAEQLLDIIQTDAAINPGNSGGPLLNISGEVIGIDVAMAQGAENIGFALPINQVKKVIDQVKTTGKISTAYLGVRYIPLDADLQKEANLSFDYGVLVTRGETMRDFAVVPGSPADKAGIVENDILLEINGTKIDADHSLISLLSQYAPNDTITLTLWHKGETKKIPVVLDERQP